MYFRKAAANPLWMWLQPDYRLTPVFLFFVVYLYLLFLGVIHISALVVCIFRTKGGIFIYLFISFFFTTNRLLNVLLFFPFSSNHSLLVNYSSFLCLVSLSPSVELTVYVSFCPFQNVEDHVAFVITVPTALAIFLAVFVLVCIESIFKKLLRVFSLVIWACLVTMGYLFMFSGGIICPWDQVRHRHVI